MDKQDGSRVLRTSLTAGLIGLGLVAAGDHAVATHCLRVADELAINRKGI